MGEIVNLRRARKNAAKARADAAAAENRVRFGRTPAEKAAARQEGERLRRRLDGAKPGSERSGG